jgi:hypothetical protein
MNKEQRKFKHVVKARKKHASYLMRLLKNGQKKPVSKIVAYASKKFKKSNKV